MIQSEFVPGVMPRIIGPDPGGSRVKRMNYSESALKRS
jgi:hypothetical protein